MGDLGVLRDLARWSGLELGAGLLLCNPLHAVAPVLPQEPSPYFPASRRFSNPLYLRIEDIPEFARLEGEAAQTVAAVAERTRRLNHGDRIDRDAVFAAKQRALALVQAVPLEPARQASLEDYRRRQGAGLEDFGVFCALVERHGTPWTRWPQALHHPAGAAVTQARQVLAARVDYHIWLQWLCEEQLVAAQDEARAAGMPVGIVHDLAVGVDFGGADGWALQDELARDMTIGAPPDPFNQQGQDWRLPPLLPNRLPESGYAPFRNMLSSILRHSGGIRIDHVMGLFRLWWVPDGASPREGTYVRYPAADLLGVLALEASRASAVVVAEDLGTVEPGVRETLREQGIFGSAVLYFERSGPLPTPPAAYPRQALASITTHDLPTAAGFWTGAGLALQEELGLLGPDTTPEAEAARAAAERAALQEALRREGLLDDDPSLEALVTAMHAFLARSASLLAAVGLGDALGDLRQPNLPGTIDEYPNWRLPLAEPRDGSPSPVLLEGLYDHPLLRQRAEIMRAQRAASAAGAAQC
jgi:4-alpha-glucanotransferase